MELHQYYHVFRRSRACQQRALACGGRAVGGSIIGSLGGGPTRTRHACRRGRVRSLSGGAGGSSAWAGAARLSLVAAWSWAGKVVRISLLLWG